MAPVPALSIVDPKPDGAVVEHRRWPMGTTGFSGNAMIVLSVLTGAGATTRGFCRLGGAASAGSGAASIGTIAARKRRDERSERTGMARAI